MWNISEDSAIIQLELGSNVILAYSSKQKNPCDILFKKINDLQLHLAEARIPFSEVQLRRSTNLPPNEFILYFGAVFIRGNFKSDDILQLLRDQAYANNLENRSYEGIMDIFQTGVRDLAAKSYQKAIYEFAQAYYCASFSGKTRDIMVNALINICGIEFLNQQYDAALQFGERACILAQSSNFFDPYLKYYAAASVGTVLIQQQDWEAAINYFIMAYNVICKTNESSLAIPALSAAAQLCMETQNFAKSAELMDRILDILQADHSLKVGEDFIIELARLHSRVHKALASQLKSEYEQLSEEYCKLSSNFLVQLKSAALNMIYKYGDMTFSYAMGSLFSSGNNSFDLQMTFMGNNVKGVNSLTVVGR